jgi:DNA-binding transcriptional regulator YiaG
MTINEMKLKKVPFNVHIPNLDGDGIALTVPIEVQAYTDPETGEDVLTPESLELIEKTQARHMGLMSAEEIKALRTRLRLPQDEMSHLLQIGAKTYTRWESGRARPSRSMNVMLCALRDGQLDMNYLRALRDPASLTEWRARSRCNYLWDFIASWAHPESRGLLGEPSEASRTLFLSRLQEWNPTASRSHVVFYAHSPGKTAWRAAMLKALDVPKTSPRAPQSQWSVSRTRGFVPLRPRHEITLDDEPLSS